MPQDMHSKTSQPATLRADRDAQIMHLRRTTPLTLQAIGEIVGLDKGSVQRVIKKHIDAILNKEAGELLVHELDKLDHIAADAMQQAFRFRVELDDKGRPLMEPLYADDGQPVVNDAGEPLMVPRRAYDAANQGKAILLKVHEARCKLLGLQAPTRIENINPAGQDSEIVYRIVDATNGDAVEVSLTEREAQGVKAGVGAQPNNSELEA